MERAELARLLGASPMVGEPAEASIVEETDADRFCTAFAGAVAAGGTVFLANPA